MELNIVLNIISIVDCVILVIWVGMDVLIDSTRKKYMILSYLIAIITIIGEIGYTIFEGSEPKFRIYSIIADVMYLGFSPFIAIINTKLYLHKMSIRKNLLYYLLPIINIIMVSTSVFTGMVFTITQNNEYIRGPLYVIFPITLVYTIIVQAIVATKMVRNYPSYLGGVIIICDLAFSTCILFQFINSEYHVSLLCVTQYGLLQYILLSQVSCMLDGLTGIMNRFSYNAQIDKIFESGKVRNLALVMADINNFKRLNDRYGHSYGDECLKETAKFMSMVFSAGSKVYRYGGDEFIIICTMTNEEKIKAQIAQLQKLINNKIKEDDRFSGIAVGYEMYHEGETIAELMKKADESMYRMKKNIAPAE